MNAGGALTHWRLKNQTYRWKRREIWTAHLPLDLRSPLYGTWEWNSSVEHCLWTQFCPDGKVVLWKMSRYEKVSRFRSFLAKLKSFFWFWLSTNLYHRIRTSRKNSWRRGHWAEVGFLLGTLGNVCSSSGQTKTCQGIRVDGKINRKCRRNENLVYHWPALVPRSLELRAISYRAYLQIRK